MATTKRKPSAAFMKPVQPDDVLSKVVGSSPLPRTELTKKLWDYIRKNGLQDKTKRTQINADDNLKAVFNGKKSVSMFEMTKLVSSREITALARWIRSGASRRAARAAQNLRNHGFRGWRGLNQSATPV